MAKRKPAPKLKWTKSKCGYHYATAPNGETWFVGKTQYVTGKHYTTKDGATGCVMAPTWSGGTMRTEFGYANKVGHLKNWTHLPEFPNHCPVFHGTPFKGFVSIHEMKRVVENQVAYPPKPRYTF